jgi:hypothetical protein
VARVGRIRRVPAVSVHYHFDPAGGSDSANPLRYRDTLAYLCQKHALGELPSTNFYLMAKHGFP